MRPAAEITGTQLTNALRALDVNFIMGGQSTNETLHKQPARLIAALAKSEESRLRLSLIPLFLEHQEFALDARTVAKKLDPAARLTLQCYYTAAVWLGNKYRQQESLPDYFSQELVLYPASDPDENLQALAKRHKELSSTWVNWLGTYLHAATIWQKGLQYKGKQIVDNSEIKALLQILRERVPPGIQLVRISEGALALLVLPV